MSGHIIFNIEAKGQVKKKRKTLYVKKGASTLCLIVVSFAVCSLTFVRRRLISGWFFRLKHRGWHGILNKGKASISESKLKCKRLNW